jgi:hypothetical protein
MMSKGCDRVVLMTRVPFPAFGAGQLWQICPSNEEEQTNEPARVRAERTEP